MSPDSRDNHTVSLWSNTEPENGTLLTSLFYPTADDSMISIITLMKYSEDTITVKTFQEIASCGRSRLRERSQSPLHRFRKDLLLESVIASGIRC